MRERIIKTFSDDMRSIGLEPIYGLTILFILISIIGTKQWSEFKWDDIYGCSEKMRTIIIWTIATILVIISLLQLFGIINPF